MKLEAIIKFSGTDKDNLPDRILHKGVLLKNFRREDDYGEGVWKTDIYIEEKDFAGLEDAEMKAEIFGTIRDFTENSTFDLEIEKLTVTAKDGEKTYFKTGGQIKIFADGGNIDFSADIGFLKNVTLSKLPSKMQDAVRDIINVAEGNFDKINFDKKEVKKELDSVPENITTKDVEKNLTEVIKMLEKEIKEKYPDAIKQKTKTQMKKTTNKKAELEAKIKGFETALKFAKGNKKAELEAKIKGFKVALKFAK